MVHNNYNNYLTLDYTKFISFIIKAIQQIDAKVESFDDFNIEDDVLIKIKNKIDYLENKIIELNNKINS